MKKGDVIAKMAEDAGVTKVQATDAYNSFVDCVSECMNSEGKLGLLGFGTFTLKKYDRREVYSPSAKKKVWVDAKNVVKFKPGKGLNERVNPDKK